MTNAYANLKTIKSVSMLDIAGSNHDGRLLQLLEDVSRWIDQHCNRPLLLVAGHPELST